MKIAGGAINGAKRRFNEDCESVTKSIREEIPKKYNLLGSAMNGDYEQKSVGSKVPSKASRTTSRTYRSRASTLKYLGSQKRGSVPETASRKGNYLNERIRRSVDVVATSTKEKFDSPKKENKEGKEEDIVEMKKSEGELNSV